MALLLSLDNTSLKRKKTGAHFPFGVFRMYAANRHFSNIIFINECVLPKHKEGFRVVASPTLVATLWKLFLLMRSSWLLPLTLPSAQADSRSLTGRRSCELMNLLHSLATWTQEAGCTLSREHRDWAQGSPVTGRVGVQKRPDSVMWCAAVPALRGTWAWILDVCNLGPVI